MALEPKELVNYSAENIFATYPQVSMNDQITAVFGVVSVETVLTYCTPVGYNEVTGFYGKWVAPDPTTLSVDTGGATGGTFTVTVNGQATSAIAYNATTDTVEAELLGLGYSVSVALASGVYTISFSADPQLTALPTVSGSVASLTGATDAAATATEGTATYGTHIIRGFIWPEEVSLSTDYQVHGQVMVSGRIPYRYIAKTVASADEPALQAELKRSALGRGLIIEDLVNIH